MGFFKKIRKSVKKAVRQVSKPIEKGVKEVAKPVEKGVKEVGRAGEKVVKEAARTGEKVVKEVARPIKQVGKAIGGAFGSGKAEIDQQAPPAPSVAAPSPAQVVDVPEQDKADGEDDAQTESARRKARAGGKKSLSVARSSGGGINI